MPVHVEKCGNKWCIVENKTGRTVGKSNSKKDAEASARIRNAAHREKQSK